MSMGEEAYDEIILFVDIAYYVKYATVYGGYGLCFLLILISAIINTGTSPFDQTTGIIAAIIYLVIAGLDTFVQLFFEPDLDKWKKFAEFSINAAIEKATDKETSKEKKGPISFDQGNTDEKEGFDNWDSWYLDPSDNFSVEWW